MILTLLTSLIDPTDVMNMVCLVNWTFQCLNTFNVDLRAVYDRVYNLLCIQRESLALESALERMPYGEDTSSKLLVIVEEIDHL